MNAQAVLPASLADALGDFATERGWPEALCERVAEAVSVLLAGHGPGHVDEAAIAALAQRHLPVRHTRAFLASCGLATSAPFAATGAWVDERLARFAPRIATEVRVWLEVLGGSGRARPKHPDTLRTYLWSAQDPLEAFSSRYESLREVTRDDVLAELAILEGSRRAMTGIALRSLFRTLKAKKLIFVNPTARLRPGRGPERPVLGLDTPTRTDLLGRVERVDHRLIVLLVGVHALSRHQICHLLLDDVNTTESTLEVVGRRRRLDELTNDTLLAWLRERADRFPTTANPYLLVNPHTAFGLAPINPSVITSLFRVLPTTAGALRDDRLLAEARACGGDPLHLVRLFGLSARTAMRYAAAADLTNDELARARALARDRGACSHRLAGQKA